MARSIGDLFDSLEQSGEEAAGFEGSTAAVPGGAPPTAGAATATVEVDEVDEVDEDEGPPPHPLAVALEDAVSDFLGGTAGERDALADAVRRAWEAARAANLLDALAAAADDLLVQPVPDPAAEVLAGELINAAVESRMAIRLGSVRDEMRRRDIIQVYAGMGDSMADAVAEALSDTDDRLARRTYVALLVEMGEAGMRVVDDMIEDSRWFVVRNGVALLGEIGGDTAIAKLTGTLAHDDARVRRETILSLAKIGAEDSGVLVQGMLSDPDAEVRAVAARAVAVLKVERALKPLMEMLESEDEDEVLERVIRALGEIGDPSAVQALEKFAKGGLLRRRPTDIRVAAYTALAAIGTPHAKSLVEAALGDSDQKVAHAARAALAG